MQKLTCVLAEMPVEHVLGAGSIRAVGALERAVIAVGHHVGLEVTAGLKGFGTLAAFKGSLFCVPLDVHGQLFLKVDWVLFGLIFKVVIHKSEHLYYVHHYKVMLRCIMNLQI